jgi:hypothetical protein
VIRGTWSLDDYRDLLGAVAAGGYRYSWFGDDTEPGRLFLRHDVDLTLNAALQMAELEAELQVSATYFLMTESIFYNLASPEGADAMERLRGLGHRIGLHAVYPNAALDERFEPVVAWHNPEPEYMCGSIPGAINVMEEQYFSPSTYRSDSNQRWRSGDPRDELRSGGFPWLQLLIHPEIWVYEGATMGQTMRTMLNAEKQRRLEQLPGDKIDMS